MTVKAAQSSSTDSPSASNFSGGYLNTLDQYMMLIQLASVILAGDNGKVSQLQAQVGNDLVQASVDQANAAKASVEKYQQELEKAKHESFWVKLGSEIAGGLMCILGAVTGNLELCAMGGIMLAMTITNASSAITGQLSSHTGLRFLEEAGIALGMGLCLGGIAALPEAFAEDAEGAEASAAKTFISKMVSKAPMMALQVAPMLNVFPDAVMGTEEILKACHIIKHVSEETAEILGTILAVGLAIGSSIKSVTSGATEALSKAIVSSLKNCLTENGYTFLKFMVLAGFMGAQGLSSGEMVQQGITTLGIAKVLEAMATNQAAQKVELNSLGMQNAQVEADQGAETQVNNAFAAMNNNWIAYVNQYATAARVIGQQA